MSAGLNTIAPPPPKASLPPRLRPLGVAAGIFSALAFNATAVTLGWKWYTRNDVFVPFDASAPDVTSPVAKKVNPYSNSPILADHCVRLVPYSKLRTTQQEELTKDFCRGVWSGLGYAYQRQYLEKKYRALPGREDQLWERKELAKDDYQVGTKITDHFEVIERTPEKVVVRCGDSPLNTAPRESDGIFSIEVTKDDKAQVAAFHLKSIFTNTTEAGANAQPLPWHFQWAHREYTKFLLESSVRKTILT